MAQLGHTDPAFTLRVYAHAMRRDEGDKEALKALVEGREWAPLGTSEPGHPSTTAREVTPENDESPTDAGLPGDGRGWVRTSDLSRVNKRGDQSAGARKPAWVLGFRRSRRSRRGQRLGSFRLVSAGFRATLPVQSPEGRATCRTPGLGLATRREAHT
jgi:hypothetical protein